MLDLIPVLKGNGTLCMPRGHFWQLPLARLVYNKQLAAAGLSLGVAACHSHLCCLQLFNSLAVMTT